MRVLSIETEAEAYAAAFSLQEWDDGSGWSRDREIDPAVPSALRLRIMSGEPPFSVALDEAEWLTLAAALEMCDGDLFRFPALPGVAGLRERLDAFAEERLQAPRQRRAWSRMRTLSPSIPSWAKPYFA